MKHTRSVDAMTGKERPIRVLTEHFAPLEFRLLDDVHHIRKPSCITLYAALKRFASFIGKVDEPDDPSTWTSRKRLMALGRIGSVHTFYEARAVLVRRGWLRVQRDHKHPEWPTLYTLTAPPLPKP